MQSCGLFPHLGSLLRPAPAAAARFCRARGPHVPTAGGVGRGVGGMRWQSSVGVQGSRGSALEELSPCCFVGGLAEGGGAASQDTPRRCTCPAPRATVSSPPVRAARLEPGLRSPVPQRDLESILQSLDGSPPRLSEGTALRAFSLYCRLSIHLQHKVCLRLGAGHGVSGPGAPRLTCLLLFWGSSAQKANFTCPLWKTPGLG